MSAADVSTELLESLADASGPFHDDESCAAVNRLARDELLRRAPTISVTAQDLAAVELGLDVVQSVSPFSPDGLYSLRERIVAALAPTVPEVSQTTTAPNGAEVTHDQD